MSLPPTPGWASSAAQFAKGAALGAWDGAKSMAQGAVDLAKTSASGLKQLGELARDAARDPQTREDLYNAIKAAAREAKDRAMAFADDPVSRLKNARDGLLAAANRALDEQVEAYEAAEREGRAMEHAGELIGRAGFEAASMLIGVGEAAKAGQLARMSKAERALGKVGAEVLPCAQTAAKEASALRAIKAKQPAMLEEVLKRAGPAKDEIDKLADELAAMANGKVAKAPLKSAERIVEKADQAYRGDVTKLKDVARNTVVVPRAKMDEITKELAKRAEALKQVKAETDAMGYSGVNSTIRTANGVLAEIQANTPEMIFAKENAKNARSILGDKLYEEVAARSPVPGGMGHELYEKWRVLAPNDPAKKALEEESRAYYNAIRAIEK